MEFDTLTFVLLGLAAAVAFALGWSIRRMLANGQEAELKRALYESKGSIPQLEAAVRTRDQRIGNYQTEADQLRSRIAALETTVSQRDTELVKRDRELRRANSELAIAKEGGLSESLHPEFQMMEGASDSAPAATPNADVRLKQAEARYEALKRGLIARDDRITELEAKLGKGPSRALETEVDALRLAHAAHAEEIASRDATIQALQSRLQDDAEQRAQFEVLAKRRTETNRELKDKLFKFESQLPKLMDTLQSRNTIIAERDAAIVGLKKDLAHMTGERDQRDRKISGLEAAVAERDTRLAARDRDLNAKRQQVATLEQELAATTQTLQSTQSTLRERESAIAVQATKLITANELAEAATRDKEQSAESFKSTVRDRDFRIAALDADVETLTAHIAKLEAELEATRPEVVAQANRLEAVEREHEILLREKDQAIESLKNVIRDRDFRIASLTADVEKLSAAADSAVAVAPLPDEQVPTLSVVPVVDEAMARRVEELEAECVRLTAVIKSQPAPPDNKSESHAIEVLESQLAEARRRGERAEDELMAAMKEAKALRARIEELESPPEAPAQANG